MAMLEEAQAVPHLISYQTRANRSPSYNEMCEKVANQIIELQKTNGTNGKIIASSVGALVLRGALHILNDGGYPLPDIILVGPVWDLKATVEKLTKGQGFAALEAGHSLPLKVSGNAGTFPLKPKFFWEALTVAMRPMPRIPSLTILTSKDDVYCNEVEARAIANSFKTNHGKPRIKIWDGGHNDSGIERDNDVLLALSRALRMPNPVEMLTNVWDRFDGTRRGHWQKRAYFKKILDPYRDGLQSREEEKLTRAKLNIARRIRVAPDVS